MKVKLPALRAFDFYARQQGYDYALVNSLHRSPHLEEFLNDLDPGLPLNWSGQSFYGLPQLRERIVLTQGYQADIDNILITSGANEANFLVMMQTVNTGDEVIAELPGWPQAFTVCEALGANVHVIRRKPELHWHFDPEELENLVNDKTRLIFLSAPNNPTGAIFSPKEMERICAIAERSGAFLLCDEVYRGLERNGRLCPAAVNHYGRAISTGGLSKTTGLQGIRIGWMACQDKALVADCNTLRVQSTQVANVLGEYIALAALEPARYARLIDGAKAAGREGWQIVSEWIARQETFSWVEPAAGFLSFPRYDLDIGSEALCKRLLAPPYRTYLRPGSAYGFDRHLRLGIGQYEADEIRRALGRITSFINDLNR